jgi:aspartate/methionine/tyrosine aminotransferase
MVSCVSSVAQKAAEAALDGPDGTVQTTRDAYRRRRDTTAAAPTANEIGFAFPSRAFYMMVDVSAAGMDGDRFAAHLLESHGVAVVPGSAFGPWVEDMVRISLCVDDTALAAGVGRIVAALRASR